MKSTTVLDAQLSHHLLERHRSANSHADVWVAYSGGVDSHLLLYYAKHVLELHLSRPVQAIHINHQLSPNAGQWVEHCMGIAEDLGVQLHVETVTLPKTLAGEDNKSQGQDSDKDSVNDNDKERVNETDKNRGDFGEAKTKTEAKAETEIKAKTKGLEAAARDARYHAFQKVLSPGDLLLLAHHQDDQLETQLYRLLRGTGPEGAVGMRPITDRGGITLLRPWLNLTREGIEQEAKRLGLHWIEDESNQSLQFDRNFLRHQVVPLLKSRWPQMGASLERFGEHCDSMVKALSEQVNEDLMTCLVSDPDAFGTDDTTALDCRSLTQFSEERQVHIIRSWLKQVVGHSAGYKLLNSIKRELLFAKSDRNPQIEWENYRIRRYNQRLYITNTEWNEGQFREKSGQIDPGLPSSSSESTANTERTLAKQQLGQWWNPSQHPRIECPWLRCHIEYTIETGTRVANDRQTLSQAVLQFGPLWIGKREGGERIKPYGSAYTRTLKKLFQERKVPAWRRDQIPLIYIHAVESATGVAGVESAAENEAESEAEVASKKASALTLIAVGDLWVAEKYAAREGEPGVKLSIQYL